MGACMYVYRRGLLWVNPTFRESYIYIYYIIRLNAYRSIYRSSMLSKASSPKQTSSSSSSLSSCEQKREKNELSVTTSTLYIILADDAMHR